MWSLVKALMVKFALFRILLKGLGSLAFLIPLALLLKGIGWPLLVVLAVLALPIFLVLLVIGLPIFLVLAVGGLLVSLLFMAMTVGAVFLKFLVFVVVPIMLVWWLVKTVFGWGDGPKPGADAA